ncbi:hypothetical protein NVS89_02700 [Ancylobacter sp. MQZ15Z-1]|uniref:Quinol:cytochrome C oxidoreductase n=1 Tax=Ancylobacter mangrovi TaxID=2972472 RepID=A0A9X2P8I0_9HYPH|nr:hypothetical protein [Ancylobacter mangrovi]MCS0493991.1 hypothetical protein [Ancylobacter mangrovi]
MSDTRSLRLLGVAGLLTSAAALGLALLVPGAMLGWLAAFGFWSGLPIGALCLSLMMGLVPGAWRPELEGFAHAMLVPFALAALAAVPVLLAIPALYEWSGMAFEGWRGIYLTPWFFVLRTLVFFAFAGIVSAFVLARGAAGGLAAGGLIVFVLLDTTAAVDWLMSLDPHFHSSGFGLYVLSIQASSAMATLVLLRLAAGGTGRQTGLLGGLLLTALLLWAYMAFMQYFISWSDNFPPIVAWYQTRARGVWSLVEYAIGALGLVPIVLLLLPPVRNGPRWLAAFAMATLLAKALEMAWLVLPAGEGGAAPVAAALLAFAGLGALGMAVLLAALSGRLRQWRLERGEAAR